ncbi:MAG: bifunctional oligoribonuclease/PAP phosphatase NrnA [Coprobacillus sp.]|nr:bifunctional oligoribonuclease/PAP phosphatase NrnA [Coprobacillus sp.]
MFSKILSAIQASSSIVIFTHMNPDGDSYCSTMAMKDLILLNYPTKQVFVTGSGHETYTRIYGDTDVVSDETIKGSLALILDCRDINRIEDDRVKLAPRKVLIDHHVSLETFDGDSVDDVHASSTCELVVDFIKESDLLMNERIANILYLGLCTDSGIFQFADDYARLFNTAQYLVEMGAEPKFAYSIINCENERDLTFKDYIYSHYQMSEHGVIYLVVDYETISNFDYTTNQVATMVHLLGNVKDYPIWIFFVENQDSSLRCEIRSSQIEVEPIAASFGGGGHPYAAGLKLPLFEEKVINAIVGAYDEEIQRWSTERL